MWLLAGVGYLVFAAAVAVLIGRSIRLADQRERPDLRVISGDLR